MSEEDLYTLEIGSVVSDNKLGARSGAPSMSAPDLYAADNGGPQNPARQKMVALRVTLLRLDKTLSAEEAVTQNETHSAIMLARKMFAPSESGDAFQKRYFDAIQRDPAVVMEHAELARLFANEPSDASPT